MDERQFSRFRIGLTVLVAIATGSWLAWMHFHGGVPSHHLLHKASLPAISNWWSGLLLPGLTWFLIGRTRRRVVAGAGNPAGEAARPRVVAVGFVAAFLFGIAVSVSFETGNTHISSYLFQSLLLIGLLVPIYRAEVFLGFVLGMSYTFGAVLPTGFGLVFAALGAALYHLIRPVLLRILKMFLPAPRTNY